MDARESVEKAAKWLASTQKNDGSFGPSESKFKEPHYYMRNIIITPQCTRALLFSGSELAVPAIKKALKFCSDSHIEDGEPLELQAFKLAALRLSNCYAKDCAHILSLIQREPVTSWKSVLNMPVLTNFSITTCISPKDLRKSTSEALVKWLEAGMAKDNKGWGPEAKSKNSEFTFTAPAVLAYVYAGGDPNSKLIQNARKFLESKQADDGSWRSSRLTIKKPTIYATAICTMALMVSSDSFGKKIQNGIQFLLKTQNEDGGWPLTAGGKSECYVTYFAVWCLSLFNYIRDKIANPELSLISERLAIPYVASTLFRGFEEASENRFKLLVLKSLLTSKAMGSTENAIKRRNHLLKILAYRQECTTADLIDELKVMPEYDYLKKKTHITQIKADLDYLKEIGLVQEDNGRYTVSFDILSF